MDGLVLAAVASAAAAAGWWLARARAGAHGDLARRAAALEERAAALDRRDEASAAREARAAAALAQAERSEGEARARAEAAAGLSRDEARRQVLDGLDAELAPERARRVERSARAAAEEAAARARDVLCTAIQRQAGAVAAEKAVTAVEVPDAAKGRVVGRDGRNVRAFERATGCDLVVDAAPGVVAVSGFDPVRREVARRALEALVADGRIDPSRIEEAVAREAAAVDVRLRAAAREALAACGVEGVPEEVERLLGRLEVRTSYGQNVLRHSVEVAQLAGTIAAEVGLDPAIARRAGLLHDLGKAIDHEVQGGHGPIGAEVARRCGEDAVVVNAIASHHEDVPQETPYAAVVLAADAISAARPGARRASEERHGRRLRELEDVARRFPGVESAFAIRAGRELRVVVDAARVGDDRAPELAREIAAAVEAEGGYPGEIRVSVFRETRATHYAR